MSVYHMDLLYKLWRKLVLQCINITVGALNIYFAFWRTVHLNKTKRSGHDKAHYVLTEFARVQMSGKTVCTSNELYICTVHQKKKVHVAFEASRQWVSYPVVFLSFVKFYMTKKHYYVQTRCAYRALCAYRGLQGVAYLTYIPLAKT